MVNPRGWSATRVSGGGTVRTQGGVERRVEKVGLHPWLKLMTATMGKAGIEITEEQRWTRSSILTHPGAS
jgi:hypothetical protein